MKFFLLISICAALSGCLLIAEDRVALYLAEGELYEPVTEGPTAKLVFSSPRLQDPYGKSFYLNLFIYRRSGECDFTRIGRIPLSLEKRQNSVLIPAGQRIYLRVAYWTYAMMDTSRKHRDISFMVIQDNVYEIEHIDNPGNLRANFYQSDATSSKQPLSIKDESCFPK